MKCQRTMLLNAARAHLAEFGIITVQRPYAPRKQAGHMTATRFDQNYLNLSLAKLGPSTHGNVGDRNNCVLIFQSHLLNSNFRAP